MTPTTAACIRPCGSDVAAMTMHEPARTSVTPPATVHDFIAEDGPPARSRAATVKE
jgi:hypothetical protein